MEDRRVAGQAEKHRPMAPSVVRSPDGMHRCSAEHHQPVRSAEKMEDRLVAGQAEKHRPIAPSLVRSADAMDHTRIVALAQGATRRSVEFEKHHPGRSVEAPVSEARRLVHQRIVH